MNSHSEPNMPQTSEIPRDAALPLSVQRATQAEQRPRHFDEDSEQPSSSEVLKVSTRSRPSAVAGAIAGVMRERGSVEVQSIGAGATNQSVKAIAIARSYLQEEGIGICFIPSFIDVAIDGKERTALRLLIQQYAN
jgi:stage V sporulation protein S